MTIVTIALLGAQTFIVSPPCPVGIKTFIVAEPCYNAQTFVVPAISTKAAK